MTDHATGVPQPLSPRDPATLHTQLSAGDRGCITTTDLPRTILDVHATHPPTSHAPPLVLTTPSRTTAQPANYATYHCTTRQSESPMTVIESTHTASDTTARCIGTLTTIAHLARQSTCSILSHLFHLRYLVSLWYLFQSIMRGEDTAGHPEVSSDA